MVIDSQNSTITVYHCSEHYIGYVPLDLYQAAGVPKSAELDYEAVNGRDDVEEQIVMV